MLQFVRFSSLAAKRRYTLKSPALAFLKLNMYAKAKVCFYIAQYPVRWTAQSALHFSSPGRPVHSDTNSASPGSILAMQQLRAKTKSLTFRYSFIQLSEQERQWRERKCPIFDTVAKGDLNPGSLYCESGILPLSYRTLHTRIILAWKILREMNIIFYKLIIFSTINLSNYFIRQHLFNLHIIIKINSLLLLLDGYPLRVNHECV